MIGASKKSSLDLDDREDDPMTLKFRSTKKSVNTQFGPVAALLSYYEQQNVLDPLQNVVPAVKKSDFPLDSQLTQVLLSILIVAQRGRTALDEQPLQGVTAGAHDDASLRLWALRRASSVITPSTAPRVSSSSLK